MSAIKASVEATIEGNLVQLIGDEYKWINSKLKQLAEQLDFQPQMQIQATVQQKGIDGEYFVESFIENHIKLHDTWSITNISKDGLHNSDLELVYKNIRCVIEVKNIKTKMCESNIKKFRDVYLHSEYKEYTSGIFVSLISGFSKSSGVSDFHIHSKDGKHAIFLANVKECPEKLLFAMQILSQLADSEHEFDKFAFVNDQIRKLKSMQTIANRLSADANALKRELRESLVNLNDI
jgi:hypothetical protein